MDGGVATQYYVPYRAFSLQTTQCYALYIIAVTMVLKMVAPWPHCMYWN